MTFATKAPNPTSRATWLAAHGFTPAQIALVTGRDLSEGPAPERRGIERQSAMAGRLHTDTIRTLQAAVPNYGALVGHVVKGKRAMDVLKGLGFSYDPDTEEWTDEDGEAVDGWAEHMEALRAALAWPA